MRGFTIIELMITLAIAAILMALAVPSYQYITKTIRMSGQLDALVGDIRYARSEAMKEGRDIEICASTDHAICSESASWQTGWIVQPVGTSTPLRVRQAFAGSETLAASDATLRLVFNREGFPGGIDNDGVTFMLQAVPDNPKLTRCLKVNLVGQLTSAAGDACL